MSSRSPRIKRLAATYARMQELCERCSTVETPDGPKPRFEFTHNGNPDQGEFPDRYAVTLRITGMESAREVKRDEHACTIYLPAAYPTTPPVIKWHTPIFHPNILTFDEEDALYRELLEEMGSEKLMTEHLNTQPQFAEVLAGFVCLDILDKNWSPSVELDAVVIEIANLVRYQNYTINSAYNQAAANWAYEKRKLRGYFPLGPGLLHAAQTAQPVVVKVIR